MAKMSRLPLHQLVADQIVQWIDFGNGESQMTKRIARMVQRDQRRFLESSWKHHDRERVDIQCDIAESLFDDLITDTVLELQCIAQLNCSQSM